MATYKKNGQRVIKVQGAKELKRNLKAFYQTIDNIRVVAEQLSLLDVIYDENNIDDYTRPFIGRDMDEYERFMMLGKIQMIQDEQRNNTK